MMTDDPFPVEKTSLISRKHFYFEDTPASSSTNNIEKSSIPQYTLQKLNLLELDNHKVNGLDPGEFEKKVKHFSVSSQPTVTKGIQHLIHELAFYGINDLTQPTFQTEDFKNGLKHDWEIDHPAKFGDLNLGDEPSLLQVLQLLHFAGYAYQIKIYIIFGETKNLQNGKNSESEKSRNWKNLQIGKKRSNSHLYFELKLDDNRIEIIEPTFDPIQLPDRIFDLTVQETGLELSHVFLQEENPLVIYKSGNKHLVYIVNNYDEKGQNGKFPVYQNSFFNIITPYELLYLHLDGFSTITYILRDGNKILYGKSFEMGTFELDRATTVFHEIDLGGRTYISSYISQFDVVNQEKKTDNTMLPAFYPQTLNLLTKDGAHLYIYHIYQHETEPFQTKRYKITIKEKQVDPDFKIYVIRNICFILARTNGLKYYSYEINYSSTSSPTKINAKKFTPITMGDATICGLYYKSFYFIYAGGYHKHQVNLITKSINNSATVDNPTAQLLDVLFPINTKDNLPKLRSVFYESIRTFQDPINPPFKTVAVEINNHLFITFKDKDNIKPLFHPIETMSIHRYYILNLYEKFYRSLHHEIQNGNNRKMLYTTIDFGYYTSLNHITQKSTTITQFSPGIYYKDPKDPKYTNDTYLRAYFFNENMQNLVTEIRPLAQLAAAFSCSYAIRVYQPNSICVEYKQRNLNLTLFNMTAATLSMIRMVATYGTLLEMKNLNQFKFALTVLEPTKGIEKEEFLSFVRRVIGLEQL